jgi:phosphoribosylaminoimidazole carboxylase PurE protein
MTMEEVEKFVGKDIAAKAKDAAMKMFLRGTELMKQRGLILIDTKYEFGLDEKGVIHVIDEVNTPDSSRLCDIQEWEAKYPKIEAEMKTGKYKNVSELLKARGDLKMKEFSKQYVRDALLDMGFDPATAKEAPKLTDEQVVECSYRYIKIYERMTGSTFHFPDTKMHPAKRTLINLQNIGAVKGGFVVIAAGSDSDMPHLENIQKELNKFGVPSQIRICSAHKQPARLEALIEQLNKSIEPLLIVGCAGGTDALSGTASFLSKHPVVSCPPDGMNNTCLTNPPGSSNAFIVKPSNIAKFAAQMFSVECPEIAAKLQANAKEKVTKLEGADEQCLKKAKLGH